MQWSVYKPAIYRHICGCLLLKIESLISSAVFLLSDVQQRTSPSLGHTVRVNKTKFWINKCINAWNYQFSLTTFKTNRPKFYLDTCKPITIPQCTGTFTPCDIHCFNLHKGIYTPLESCPLRSKKGGVFSRVVSASLSNLRTLNSVAVFFQDVLRVRFFVTMTLLCLVVTYLFFLNIYSTLRGYRNEKKM